MTFLRHPPSRLLPLQRTLELPPPPLPHFLRGTHEVDIRVRLQSLGPDQLLLQKVEGILRHLPRIVESGTLSIDIRLQCPLNGQYHFVRFFEQDEEAGRLMTATMANVPSHQRAPFTRLQASIRSAYHETVRVRKTAEFRAVLSSTQPGGSLMPHSRADPSGPLAKKERLERFDRFVRSWCSQGLPGTNALFEGLWVLMRLQVVPEHLGGAGARRIEWEIDDAVFQEAA